MAEKLRPTLFKFEIPTFVDGIRSSWIETARAHVKSDEAMQEKIGDQPYDPKHTRVTGSGFGDWVVTLNYGSLAYATLWTIPVQLDSMGKVTEANAKLYGFE